MQKIIYPKEPDLFFKETRKRVEAYFKDNNFKKFGGRKLLMKYFILKIALLSVYTAIFLLQETYFSFLPFIILGPISIILVINVSHDGIHGVASSIKWLNNYFTLQMDLIGANSFVWKKRHQFGHHMFPNTLAKDPDLSQSNLVRILPGIQLKWFHKFQHIYVPVLYAFYTINWIYIRDFVDFFSSKSLIKNIPKVEHVKLFVFKSIYIIIFLFVPFLFTSLSFKEIVFNNLLMHISASYFLTIALVPSHVSEKSVFIQPNEIGEMPYSWSHHQVITTADFATDNKVMTWLLGGFNHHVSHHLFPRISHVHYPRVTSIVKETTKKYNLKYSHEKSLFKAYVSHFNLLKNNG